MSPLRIAFVSSEIAPFAKTGGLADVSLALGRFLGRRGAKLRLFMPLYRRIRESTARLERDPLVRDVPLQFAGAERRFSLWNAPLPDSDQTVTFIDCPEYFDRPDIYSSDDDEPLRFAFLSEAAIVACQYLQFAPDIFHCNDWHTGLLPLCLRARYAWDDLFNTTQTVLTIHNLGYQGVFPRATLDALGWNEHEHLFFSDDNASGIVNYLKTGILYADALTTVSETYAREIRRPELGMGLDEFLEARSDSLFGITNGVDYDEWNPATDTLLPFNYSADDMGGKAKNKGALLRKFELDDDESVPLIGVVSRLTAQKGFELLPDILPVFLQRRRFKLIVLGSGEETHEHYFQWLRDAFPESVGFYRGYDNALSHLIEAGSDMFLMPSRYEPCGLNQMYSLKYGTVPIVRRTGGLADTVEAFDAHRERGTGFLFDDFTPEALYGAIDHALAAFAHAPAWQALRARGMAVDYSWERQGENYLALYERLRAAAVQV